MEYKEAEQQKELLLTLSRSQFAALDNANAKYNANLEIIEKLKYDYNNLAGQQTRADEEMLSLDADYKANLERIEALRAFRARRSEEMGVLDERRDEIISKANELSISIASSQKDVENVQQQIQALDARIAELENEKNVQNARIAELEDRRSNIDSKKAEGSAEYESLQKTIDELRQKRSEVESGSDEFERELANIRVKIKEKSSSRQVSYESVIRSENRLTQLEEKQDKLGSQLWDDYEITYEDAVALDYPVVTAENRDEVAAHQSSCRAKLRALGNYNPGAIEEYAEVKTRYDALNTQFALIRSLRILSPDLRLKCAPALQPRLMRLTTISELLSRNCSEEEAQSFFLPIPRMFLLPESRLRLHLPVRL